MQSQRTGAAFAKGRSRQDYGTPADFIAAVERRFGPIAFDLAAHDDGSNAKARHWYGPSADALSQDWTRLEGNLFLNPPFGNIGPWAAKASESLAQPRRFERILVLVPASVGSLWYSDFVHGRALVLALQPRLAFEGCTSPFPKDLILAVYGEPPGFEPWSWRTPRSRRMACGRNRQVVLQSIKANAAPEVTGCGVIGSDHD